MEMSDALVFPRELIVDILSWVPVKALIRFRCVSKTWNPLILNPTFVKLHLKRSSKNTHILLKFVISSGHYTNMTVGAAACSIPRLLENPSSTIDDCLHQFNLINYIFGSCNGLVCMNECFVAQDIEVHWFRFWNPATRIMSEHSPPLSVKFGDKRNKHYSVNCGFGFDDSNDTYKVVVLLCDIESQTTEVRVLCLGDTNWINIMTYPTFPILGKGQSVSGTVNWLALNMSSVRYRWETVTIDQLVIFSYDLNNETYRYLRIPEGLLEVPRVEPYFGVLKGCLCLSHDHRKIHFEVWLMREFGVENSWTQLLKVNYEHLQNHNLPPFIGMPLCMSQDEDVVLLTYHPGAKFVLYNRRDKRIDQIEDCNNKFSFSCYDYVQSLVLPHRN